MGNWKESDKITIGEIPMRPQLWDRQDYFAIFKADKTDEERKHFSKIKQLLSRVQFRPGHSLLKMAIHYIVTNSDLQETRFSDTTQVSKLSAFWNKLSKKYQDQNIMGPRSYETVFRTASVIARILQKVEVDSEVVTETIEFLTQMYGQLDGIKIQRVELVGLTFNTMRQIIKEHSQKKSWAEEQQRQLLKENPNSKKSIPQLPDMTFNEAAEIACKQNDNIDEYIGKYYKHRDYRAIRNLRAMFRERQYDIFEGGRVQVVSKAKEEIVLRWIPIV
jgi:hypothetical protein